MKTKLTFLFLFLFVNYGQSSDSLYLKNRSIAIFAGPTIITLKDKTISPLRYQNTGFVSQLGFNSTHEKRVHDLQFYISQGELNSVISTRSAHFMNYVYAGLEYAYLKKIKNSKSNIYLGGAFQNTFSIKELNFEFGATESSYDISSTLNLAFFWQKKLNNNHQFQYQIRYPLIAYVIGRVRQPGDIAEEVLQEISGQTNTNPSAGTLLKTGDFLTLNKYIDFQSEIKYLMNLGKRINISAVYLFRYIQFPKLNKFQFGRNEIKVGIHYNW